MLTFSPNANASMFVGARGPTTGSTVVLLSRTGADLIICEHGTLEPSSIVVAFSPDGRLVFYHSDRGSGSAIYNMSVEELVEPTEV